ncbi:protein-lysine N-methyltransferase SMYD4-like [Saccoglossus kowalevskii]|uniref:Protein-lysine N-methyltransferase SMYD4 n=1 Tax=Saccoglossus kowalevskii TaxID=10224 RepID=A0ABM0GZM2_SACKO|nr:PREDICTED: SET and MYND domain-containing protein 4-like [Saccoglossus kowalevskii]
MEKGNLDNSSDEFNVIFEKVSDKLKENADVHGLSEEFAKFQTNEERIKFGLSLDCIQDVIKIEPKYEKKTSAESKKLRSKGNTAFQKKQFDKALYLYTESVMTAPIQEESNCEELSLAFGNRAAVLLHMGKFEYCLDDIDRAFEYGYPEDLKYKLYDRRGQCFYNLKRKFDAIACFKDAMSWVDKSKLDRKKRKSFKVCLDKQLDKCQKMMESTESVGLQKKLKIPPKLSYGSNLHVPCMSSAVTIESSPDKGRYAVATRDVKVGDVLIVENPYSSVGLQPCNVSHCHHCYIRVLASIPCLQCAGIVYCSKECRNASWEMYHNLECHHLDLIQELGLGMGHLALRTIIRTGLAFLLKFREQSANVNIPDESFHGCTVDGEYESNYYSVYNLVGHSEDRKPGDLFKRVVKAVCLLRCLQQTNFFQSVGADNEEDVAIFIGGHMLTHLQTIPCNAHEISEYELWRSDITKCHFVEVGSGLYPTMSLVNHSCDPVVTRNCYGETCVVRAIRNIYKGEEITDNYGYLYPVHDKSERQTRLKWQYFFECKCDACVHDWPLYPDIEDLLPKYKCEKCHKLLKLPAVPNMKSVTCAKCQCTQDIMQRLSRFATSNTLYKDVWNNVLNGKFEGAQSTLNTHLILMDDLFCPPWKDINNCQEALKQCFNVIANCTVID